MTTKNNRTSQLNSKTKTTRTEPLSTHSKIISSGGYVGTHATSFKDFLLKDELLRAINEAGFENPS